MRVNPRRAAVPVQTGKLFHPTAGPRAGDGQRGVTRTVWPSTPRAVHSRAAKVHSTDVCTPRSRQHASQRQTGGSSPRVHRQTVAARNVVLADSGLSLSLKRKGIPPPATTWLGLEDIVLSEMGRTRQD